MEADASVLLTGAGTGIGMASARRLAVQGARVLLVGRRPEVLQTAQASLAGSGHEVLAVDAADEPSLSEGARKFVENSGPFTAGIFCAGAHLVRPLAVSKAEHYESQIRANLMTAAISAKVFAKYAAKSGAAMVFVSSAAAIRGGATVSAYSAAKGAILGLARSLAVELASRRIRVNTVVPGVVRTEMTENFFSSLAPEQCEMIARSHLLGLGEPDDVAAAICFLASSDARWITGVELVVDGGLTCK